MFLQLQLILSIIFSIAFHTSYCLKYKQKPRRLKTEKSDSENDLNSVSGSNKMKEQNESPDKSIDAKLGENIEVNKKISEEVLVKHSKKIEREKVKERPKDKEVPKEKEKEKKTDPQKRTTEKTRPHEDNPKSANKEPTESSAVTTAKQPATLTRTKSLLMTGTENTASMKATQKTTGSISRKRNKKQLKSLDKSLATTLPREKRGYHKDIIAEQEALLSKMMDEKSEDQSTKDDVPKTQEPNQ